MGAPSAAGLALLAVAAVASATGPARLRGLRYSLAAAAGSSPQRKDEVCVYRKPIEQIAYDAHRLSRRFHTVPPTLSFARFEGLRRAYDSVLTEACRALEVEHLLEVLPPGPELDVERRRVETVLDHAGLRLYDVV